MISPNAAIELDVSGLALRLRGADEAMAASFLDLFGPFLVPPGEGPVWLDVELAASARAIVTRPAMRPSLVGEVGPEGARFTSDEGEIEMDAAGRARATVGAGDPSWRFWGLMNLLTAAMAARMASRPGALLHAAGIVLDGRAFVLVGPEGAGKSTWARLAREAGARVVSDDAVLLDAASGRFELLGSPVRAHEAEPLGPGRWPLAAILHAAHGAPARLDSIGRLAVEARLAANLLFVVSAWGKDPRVDAVVHALAESVPHRTLTFAPDPSFVGVLRAARW